MFRKTKMLCAVTLAVVVVAVGGFSQTPKYPKLQAGDQGVRKGWMTRYWDACKPHCGRVHKSLPLLGACKTCTIDNKELPLYDFGDNNSCVSNSQQPKAYACWDQIPFRDPDDPNLAYAFGATPGADGGQCGKCYQLQFNGEGMQSSSDYTKANHKALLGKTLIMMASNIGHDVDPVSSQFDIMVPGGGVGAFDALSSQIGVSKEQLGAGFGGFVDDCRNQFDWQVLDSDQILTKLPECLREKCKLFDNAGADLLYEGCLFYADWLLAADNPSFIWKELPECPDVLVRRFVENSGGSNPTPMNGGNPPAPRTILTVLRDPNNPSDWGQNYHNGQSVTFNVTGAPAGNKKYNLWIGMASSNINMQISINNTQIGTIVKPEGTSKTDNNSNLDPVMFDDEVTLNSGSNTVTLTFPTQAGSHVTYIRLVETAPPTSIGHGLNQPASRTTVRSAVTLKSVPKGFTAMLPSGHGYTSYRLIDLRGREIRKGTIGKGMTDLRFDNIKSGVVFLRLDGNTSATIRVTALR